MAQDWTRIEGMIIGHELDPSAVAGELKKRAILAQIEWFPSSPQLLGLNVAVADERVATVPAGATTVVPGPTPAELADELAILFKAEVRIGNASADHLPEGDSPLGKVWPSEEETTEATEAKPTRIVEIGRTPASSVPLLAALEGVDLGDLELADDHRALLAELPAEKEGWNFGDLPLVTLSVTDGEFQVFLVTDDHLEHIVSHNWGMDAAIVPGGHNKAQDLPGEIIDLVGDRLDLLAIARAVPGADADALWASVATTGEESVWKVVRALGLPGSVAGFLLGTTDARRRHRAPRARHFQRNRSQRGHHDGAATVDGQAPVELLRIGRRRTPVDHPRRSRSRGYRRRQHAGGRRARPCASLRLAALRRHRRRPHGRRLNCGAVACQARLQAFRAPCGRGVSPQA